MRNTAVAFGWRQGFAVADYYSLFSLLYMGQDSSSYCTGIRVQDVMQLWIGVSKHRGRHEVVFQPLEGSLLLCATDPWVVSTNEPGQGLSNGGKVWQVLSVASSRP